MKSFHLKYKPLEILTFFFIVNLYFFYWRCRGFC